jgi:hypothetical protein
VPLVETTQNKYENKMEDSIMAEINELKKNVEEGELTDEALDGAAGGMADMKINRFESNDVSVNHFKVSPGQASIHSVSEKRENC